MISNRNLSILLLITGSVGVSFGGLIMRNINNTDPWQIAFYRGLAFLFSMSSRTCFGIQFEASLPDSRFRGNDNFFTGSVGYPVSALRSGLGKLRGNDKQIRDGLIISWGLIPRPLGRKYLITFPMPRCLRRGSIFLVMKIL